MSKVVHSVENSAAPGSEYDGSMVSSRYVTEECCICGPELYILQFQTQDGSAVGKYLFILLLGSRHGRVVDAWCQSVDSIDCDARKRICDFITLPRDVLYPGSIL